MPDSIEILIEDDPEEQPGGGKDMFDSFRDLILRSVEQETQLARGWALVICCYPIGAEFIMPSTQSLPVKCANLLLSK